MADVQRNEECCDQALTALLGRRVDDGVDAAVERLRCVVERDHAVSQLRAIYSKKTGGGPGMKADPPKVRPTGGSDSDGARDLAGDEPQGLDVGCAGGGVPNERVREVEHELDATVGDDWLGRGGIGSGSTQPPDASHVRGECRGRKHLLVVKLALGHDARLYKTKLAGDHIIQLARRDGIPYVPRPLPLPTSMSSTLAIRLGVCALLVGAGCLSAAAESSQPRTGIHRLGWLAGCWERVSGALVMEEQWQRPRGDAMLGVSRTTRRDTVVQYEHLRIFDRGGKTVYAALPSGQALTG